MKTKILLFFIAIFCAISTINAQTLTTIGSNSGSNTGSNSYPQTMGNYYWGQKNQSLYTAAELTAAGLTPGALITAVGYNVTNVNACPNLTGFNVGIKTTATTTFALNAAWETGMTTIFSPAGGYQPIVGWNMFSIASPIVWNGTDNLIIETCSNNGGWISNGSASCQWTTGLSANLSAMRNDDNSTVCANLTNEAVYSARQDLQISYTLPSGCIQPVSIATSAITTTTVDVSWTDPNTTTAPTYDIYLDIQGAPAPTNATVPTFAGSTGSPQTVGSINPLSQNTSYDVYVRARCSGSDTSNWGGPVSFTTIATCLPPTGLNATNITNSGADLNWVGNANDSIWQIELIQAGGAFLGSPTVSSATSPYAQALPSSFCVEYKVRAVCSSTDSSAWSPTNGSFCTLCDPAGLPYCFDFDTVTSGGANNPPLVISCWDNYSTQSTSTTDRWASNVSGGSGPDYGVSGAVDHTSGTGRYAWVDFSDISASDGDAVLETERVDVSTLTVPRLSFWVLSNNTNNPTDNNTLYVDVWDGASWNNDVITYAASDSSWINVTYDMATLTITGAVQARIRARNTAASDAFYNDILIDDICWVEAPSCLAPTNLMASNITATSADVSWLDINLSAPGNNFDIEVIASGTAPTGVPSYINVTTPYNLTGLTSLNAVDVYVRASCSATDSSTWVGPLAILPCSSLAGTYTIDPAIPTGGTNFQSFSDAALALQCGITAPVVFDVNIAGSPYNEEFDILEVTGSSPTNTITWNGNGSVVTFASNPASTTDDRHTMRISGADHMIFNDINFENTGTLRAHAVHIWNDANDIKFKNCEFKVSTTVTGFDVNAFVVSNLSASPASVSAVEGCDSIVVDSCSFIGGYYGAYIVGASPTYSTGNAITNSTIKDFYLYGSYNVYHENYLFSKNEITRPTRSSGSAYGIYATTGVTTSLFEKNHIHDFFSSAGGSGGFYGFYFFVGGTSAATSNIIENNLIEDIGGNNEQYGIYSSSSNWLTVRHNTIVLDNSNSTSGDTRGITQFGTGVNGQFNQNNNIVVSRAGNGQKYGMYLQATAGGTESNNNVYITSTGGTNYYGYWNSANCADLTAWTAAGGSATDLDVDPIFVNPAIADYTPGSIAMNDQGAALGVVDDYLDSVRSTSTPDIGAFEFSILPIDVAATAIISPDTTVGCYSAAETVSVEITNYGSTALDLSVNPVTVTGDVTGAVTQTLTATVNTGTLAPLGTLTVPLAATIDMTANGTYTINAWTTMTADGNATNDTLSSAYNYNVGVIAGNVAASLDILCQSGTSDLSISGNFGGTIQWQEGTSNMGPWTNVGTGGTTFTTPTLTQTTYYRAVLTCNTNMDSTDVDTVIVNNPMILTSMSDTVCGPNSATLMATSASATINWYANLADISPLDTGSSFVTPVISATDTFYAAALDGQGKLLITEVCNFDNSLGYSTPVAPVPSAVQDPLEFTNVGFAPLDISGWKVEVTGASAGTFIFPAGAVVAPNSTVVLGRGTSVGPNVVGQYYQASTLPTAFSGSALGVILSDGNGNVIDVMSYSGYNVVGTGTPQATAVDWSGTTVGGSGTAGWRRTNLDDNNSANDWTLASTSNLVNFGALNVAFTPTSCEGARVPVIAVVNPSPGTLAQATASNATSTTGNTAATAMHMDGANLSYFTPTCELVCAVEDAPGGNALGSVTSQVTIDSTVQVWNMQPYTRRWFDITPTNQGPGDVTLYQTQNDFDDYNTYATANGWPLLPTGPADAAGIANMRVTKLSGGTLGTGTPTLITPTATWDAANARWEITFPVTSFSEFYVHTVNPNNAVLPVVLSSFNVTKNGSVADAAWITQTEINNSHFNLQRSTDGSNFTTLGRVNSAAPNGNSNIALEYSFTDVDPQTGHNYYRLQQVDIDGQSSYSDVVDLIWGTNGSAANIYPNPATDKLYVDISTQQASQVEVRILDMSGRTVKSVIAKTQSGVNNIKVSLDDIATGLYGVQVYTNNKLTHVDKVRVND